MKRSTLLAPSVALVALALVSSTTAFAQERERGRDRGERQSEGRAVERGERRSETPRAEQPRQEQRAAEQPRQEARPAEQPRRQEQQAEQPRRDSRRYDSRSDPGRHNDVAPRRDNHDTRRETAVPRTYAPRYEPRYAPRYTPRYDPRWNGRYIVPRYYEPRWYQPRFYYRPYVFRPRFSIGFGIFAGYPVPYTYGYPSYAYGVYGASYYGGVSLDIAPFNAEVFVDGVYSGLVEDFDGTRQPLTLRAGRHRIEVQSPGYANLVFDVDVIPGQIIPYRGDLEPY